jgi:hypothetical protein
MHCDSPTILGEDTNTWCNMFDTFSIWVRCGVDYTCYNTGPIVFARNDFRQVTS